MILSDNKLELALTVKSWKALERLGRHQDAVTFATMVLVLVFIRAQDQVLWSEARSARPPHIGRLVRNLPSEISDGIEGALSALHDLHVGALAEMMDIIEDTVAGLDPASIFGSLLEEFARRGGKRSGDLMTPKSVAAVLVNSLDMDAASTVYDPFCRSGELLVAAARARGGADKTGLSVYGTSWNMHSLGIARMYIQLGGLRGELDGYNSELVAAPCGITRFSRVVSNPPFNVRDWSDRGTHSWRYGPPPPSNANYAWLQRIVESLEPGGCAAVVMANGALFSVNPREQRIRARMVDDGCVEALIALPPGLFYSTGIPVTVWLLNPPGTPRDNILFVDASGAGHMVNRAHRELGHEDISRITQSITSWRSGNLIQNEISAISVPVSRVQEQAYNLIPSMYANKAASGDVHEMAKSRIWDLLERLESQHIAASEKDAIALQVLGDLRNW